MISDKAGAVMTPASSNNYKPLRDWRKSDHISGTKLLISIKITKVSRKTTGFLYVQQTHAINIAKRDSNEIINAPMVLNGSATFIIISGKDLPTATAIPTIQTFNLFDNTYLSHKKYVIVKKTITSLQ